jgi:hypothetical protein
MATPPDRATPLRNPAIFDTRARVKLWTTRADLPTPYSAQHHKLHFEQALNLRIITVDRARI